MSLFILLSALLETVIETAKENYDYHCAIREQKRYEDIDWENIEYVTLDFTETTYRTETEEEFDPVATHFLSQRDGWPHYETKTVEYEVEDGENYCFTVKYKDGTEIYRKFHKTSPITERLLAFCD